MNINLLRSILKNTLLRISDEKISLLTAMIIASMTINSLAQDNKASAGESARCTIENATKRAQGQGAVLQFQDLRTRVGDNEGAKYRPTTLCEGWAKNPPMEGTARIRFLRSCITDPGIGGPWMEWKNKREAAGLSVGPRRDFDVKAPSFAKTITIDPNNKPWNGIICGQDVSIFYKEYQGQVIDVTVSVF